MRSIFGYTLDTCEANAESALEEKLEILVSAYALPISKRKRALHYTSSNIRKTPQ